MLFHRFLLVSQSEFYHGLHCYSIFSNILGSYSYAVSDTLNCYMELLPIMFGVNLHKNLNNDLSALSKMYLTGHLGIDRSCTI